MNTYSQQHLKTQSTQALYVLKSKLIAKLAEPDLAECRKDALIAIISAITNELKQRHRVCEFFPH